MKAIFDESGRFAFTADGVCAIPPGFQIADVPDELVTKLQHVRLVDGQVCDITTSPTLNEVITELCRRIDTVADAARLAIAGDPLRVVEYERAATEAQAYKDAGYTGTAPPAVKSWADAKNWDGQRAADNILIEAAVWNQALYGIRDMRLKGKEAVRNTADEATAQASADAVISQIRSAVASVGNAK